MLDTRTFSALVGIDPTALSRLLSENPKLKAGVKGGRRFTIAQAIGLNLARSLKKNGVTPDSCGKLLQVFWECSDADLEAAIGRGESWLAVLSDSVIPRLMGERQARNPAGIHDAVQKLGLSLSVLDVSELVARMKAAAAQLTTNTADLELETA